MNACTTMPHPIPLYRPLWLRLAEQLADAWKGLTAARTRPHEMMDLQDALSLNDQTLRDIGVSEALRDEAAARRSIASIAERAAMHDFGDRGRHWYG
jgi:uncharacterized protein YjiS (DUF1127 family)